MRYVRQYYSKICSIFLIYYHHALFSRSLLLIFFIFPINAFAACIGLNCTCSISSSTLSFGTYSPFDTNPTSGTMDLSVTCSALVVGLTISYAISLNQGSSNSYASRTMKFSNSNLNYNIYTSAALTTVWGDGTSGTGTISDFYNLSLQSVTRFYRMYGLLPARQNVKAGTYTDTLVATVTF